MIRTGQFQKQQDVMPWLQNLFRTLHFKQQVCFSLMGTLCDVLSNCIDLNVLHSEAFYFSLSHANIDG